MIPSPASRPAAVAVLGLVVLAGCTDPAPTDPEPTSAPAPPQTAAPADVGCDLQAPTPPCAAWTVSGLRPPLAAGDQLVVGTAGRQLVAHAVADGAELWRAAPTDGQATPAGAQVLPAGVLVTSVGVGGASGATTALLAPEDGRVVWEAPGAATLPGLDGEVVGLLDGEQLTVVDTASGDVLWQRPAAGLLGPSLAAGEVLVASQDTVALVDTRDGSVRWELERAAGSTTLGAQGGTLADRVAIVTVDGTRQLVDRTSGEPTTDQPLPSRLEVVGGQLVALSDSSVDGLAANGTVRWSQTGRPLIARGGAALLVGAEAEGREAIGLLDPTTGEVLWQVDADRNVREVVASDTQVAIARTGSVVLRDRATGEELVRVDTPEATVVSISPLVLETGGLLVLIEAPA